MGRVLLALLLVAAVVSPHAWAIGKPEKTPLMKLDVAVEPSPAKPGEAATVKVSIVPPEGIALNRYPGITLRIDKADRAVLAANEAFVGSKKPIKEVSEFAFTTIDPLVLTVTPQPGGGATRQLEGELKFFYCVKASGYCAPGTQAVKLDVPVAR